MIVLFGHIALILLVIRFVRLAMDSWDSRPYKPPKVEDPDWRGIFPKWIDPIELENRKARLPALSDRPRRLRKPFP
jgi:hypothetical protein